ncbi:MAG: hypothetical protein IKN12_09020 [Selenomonadaceae bacterium]|nr:hypothetical protein [Selenomonadaceae bacterium]
MLDFKENVKYMIETFGKRKNVIHTYCFTLGLLLFFSLLLRPISLDAVDIYYNRSMTEDERKLSYGLPFHIKKPPINPGRRLSRAELRWVFLTEIRLDAIKEVIHEANERAHRAYSAMAQDFNVRGANYEYEYTEYRAAKKDIEKHREIIVENAVTEAVLYGLTRP